MAQRPAELQTLLDLIAESAARVCGARDATIRLLDGDQFPMVAHFGEIPTHENLLDDPDRPGPSVGRAFFPRETIHLRDAQRQRRFPRIRFDAERLGMRTFLATPLRQDGVALGAIIIRRTEVKPFTPREIAQLEAYASLAAAAIENARLAQEVEGRNQALAEALEQQTATAEVLRIIASSPTELQPVLDAIAEKALQVCDAQDATLRLVEGRSLRRVVYRGGLSAAPPVRPLTGETPGGLAVLQGRTIHVADPSRAVELFGEERRADIYTAVAVPLKREGAPIGVISIRRGEARPFTEKQIALLETFADQAVIAIDNVRLFQEIQERNRALTEALEQKTATGEVLRIIASSPADLQPTLDAIVEHAARLFGAEDATLLREDGGRLWHAAGRGIGGDPVVREAVREGIPLTAGTTSTTAFLERRTLRAGLPEELDKYPGLLRMPERMQHGAVLAVPLKREGAALGTLSIFRPDRRPFTDDEAALLETFADQAVIAIENARLIDDLRVALEQQTAMAEVLRIIAGSPTNLRPVLDAICATAARVCGSDDGVIRLIEGDMLPVAASYGTMDFTNPSLPPVRNTPEWPAGRAIAERRTVHVEDAAAEGTDFPASLRDFAAAVGLRTTLAVPLQREGDAIGAIVIWRPEVRPFTERQIALLETFADQAVIAIENARLFREIAEANRDLTEALGRQTATAEVLQTISRSAFDLQAVLNTVVENAARLCQVDQANIHRLEGDRLPSVASYHLEPQLTQSLQRDPPRVDRGSTAGRVVLEGRPIHIHDITADPDYNLALPVSLGYHTVLGVPLLRDGAPIGVIILIKRRVEPFTDGQIEMIQTFADQAVIAIENARLLGELREALDHQTATSEVLGIIAASPTEYQPVLDAIAEKAAKVCGADDATIRFLETDALRLVAHHGTMPQAQPERAPLERRLVANEALRERRTVHVPDTLAAADRFPDQVAGAAGAQTRLSTPLLREGTPIGVINVRRDEVQPFSEKEIALLETFARQAVIAIENARLFREIAEANRELTDALERQTATSDVLRIMATSPADLQPVLDAITRSAAQLCGVENSTIRLVEGDALVELARYGTLPAWLERIPVGPETTSGRSAAERRTIHAPDLLADADGPAPDSAAPFLPEGRVRARAVLATPLLREGGAVGVITVAREEPGPFTPEQVALLETFADQAAIAIQNVQLFREIERRNAELAESLDHQTATAEVLRIIASSPTDVQPVLDAIAESAARVCGAMDVYVRLIDGDRFRIAAHYGSIPVSGMEDLDVRRARDFETVMAGPFYVPDVLEPGDGGPRTAGRRLGFRSWVAVPLKREREGLGAIVLRHAEPNAISEKQIKLLQTFADQAVIAIDNVRLFNDLREALERQTATAEVLRIISGSPTEIRPVLDAIAETAARVFDASGAGVYRVDDGMLETMALHGVGVRPVGSKVPITPDSPLLAVAAVLAGRTVHVPDIREIPEDQHGGLAQRVREGGPRTFLSAPMRRGGAVVGAITVTRRERRPFTDQQIALVETFADQAVIAMENVRLFEEIAEASRQLEIASQHKSDFLASMSHELRTPLNAIISFSEMLQEDARDQGDEDYIPDLEEGCPLKFRGQLVGRRTIDGIEMRWSG